MSNQPSPAKPLPQEQNTVASPPVPGLAQTATFIETASFIRRLMQDGAGIYLLTGKQGVGKSAVLKYSELSAPENVVVLVHSFRRIDVDNLSDLLGHTLGVKLPEDLPPEARALRYFLKLGTIRSKGKRLILMLDDVEELHSSGAELLKALVNMKDQSGPLITVILCGRTSLNAFLDKSYRWGIQRLIREHHEMQPISAQELPALVDALSAGSFSETVPLKKSAIATLYSLSQGIPGRVQNLLESSRNLADRYSLRHISSRLLKGASNGDFRTVPQLLGAYAGKVVAAMALLLVIPVALFQQDLQQPLPPVAPPTSVNQPVATETEAVPVNTAVTTVASVLDQQPAVAVIADDISPDLTVAGVTETAETLAVAAVESSDSPFQSFRVEVPRIDLSSVAVASPVWLTFNQTIPSERQNASRILGEFNLSIPLTNITSPPPQ